MHRLLSAALLALLTSAFATPVLAQPPTPAADRLVVAFHEMPSGMAKADRYLGAPVLAVDEALGFAVVEARDPQAFRRDAAHRPEVRLVESDPVRPLLLMTPNDPEFGVSQYGPQLIGAPAAWDTILGNGAVVCVIDTGVRYTHQEFQGRYLGGIDLVNNDNDPMDDHGHGTHVAGIAVAGIHNGVGIAGVANAGLLSVKVLDATGAGTMSNVATAIRWCADNGAHVINLSLGGTSGLSVLQGAVDYAWNRGVILAAASGNSGCTNCVMYPAAYDNVLAVGCVDPNVAVCTWTSKGPQLDLAAPGSSIQSTWFTADNAYKRAAGTSMSAPHVAGAAALLRAAAPDRSNVDIRAALESTAQDLGAAGKDTSTGHGLVRVDLAMAALLAPTQLPAPTPPPPAPEPQPQPVPASVEISPGHQAKNVASRGTTTYAFQVKNTGAGADTFAMSTSGLKGGWTANVSPAQVTLEPGQSATVTLTVTAPKAGSSTVTLTAASATAQATGTAMTTVAR
jgi:subtilisin family serine protease